jgi:transposase-like protein
MNCPNCHSKKIRKNGHRRGKQNYQCKECGRQFITQHSQVGYPSSVKENCLKMYVNGMGFRALERVMGVNHNTVIRWVRNIAIALPDAPEVSEIPEITEIDELQTFVGKKNQRWLWTAVNHWQPGILAWVLGERSSQTFKPLWKLVRGWQSFLYVTDGWTVDLLQKSKNNHF